MLKDQLQETKEKSQLNLPQDIATSFNQMIEELRESSLLDNMPKVGDKLQPFTLTNAIGEQVSSEDYIKMGKSLVISFYRGGWCPYCNLELRAYQDILEDIRAKGAEFIAISPEIPDASLSLVEKQELDFQVLSDIDNAYANELGLMFKMNDTVTAIYKKRFKDLENNQGNDRYELPVPATIVVNPKGEIIYIFADVDYKNRAEPAEVLAYL